MGQQLIKGLTSFAVVLCTTGKVFDTSKDTILIYEDKRWRQYDFPDDIDRLSKLFFEQNTAVLPISPGDTSENLFQEFMKLHTTHKFPVDNMEEIVKSLPSVVFESREKDSMAKYIEKKHETFLLYLKKEFNLVYDKAGEELIVVDHRLDMSSIEGGVRAMADLKYGIIQIPSTKAPNSLRHELTHMVSENILSKNNFLNLYEAYKNDRNLKKPVSEELLKKDNFFQSSYTEKILPSIKEVERLSKKATEYNEQDKLSLFNMFVEHELKSFPENRKGQEVLATLLASFSPETMEIVFPNVSKTLSVITKKTPATTLDGNRKAKSIQEEYKQQYTEL